MKFLERKLSILGILCIEFLDIITDQKLKAELNIKSKDSTIWKIGATQSKYALQSQLFNNLSLLLMGKQVWMDWSWRLSSYHMIIGPALHLHLHEGVLGWNEAVESGWCD